VKILSFLLVFFISAIASAGPIYVIKESGGVVRFSTKKPVLDSNFDTFTAKGKGTFARYSVKGSYGRHYQIAAARSQHSDLIKKLSTQYGIDLSLVKAVIHAESAFNEYAVSQKGARGLMQLLPTTAALYGVYALHSPEQNLKGGIKHLKYLIGLYKGDLKLALAAYNAGEGAVKQYSGIPPYRETQQYVRKVLELRDLYCRENVG